MAARGVWGWALVGVLLMVAAGGAGAASKPAGAAKPLPAAARFTSVAAAQASCPADVVVWSSFTGTRSFHLAKSKYFGKTKHGAYLCEKAALAAGFHQART
jgi:hypothetical protein